jgi:nucleotide-binding universal stress UspA family protein
MSYKTILLELRDEADCHGWIEAAAGLAEAMGAELVGIHVTALPVIPVGLGDAAGYVDAEVMEVQREAGRAVQARVGQAFAGAVPAGLPQRLLALEDVFGSAITDAARTVDLTILGPAHTVGLTPAPAQSVDDVLVHAGGPVMVLPRARARLPSPRVMVAWNASRQAARAVKDALPLLKAAQETVVVEITEAEPEDRAGLDAILAMLVRHGVTVRGEQRAAGSAATSARLLEAASELGADLLVMGAYSHSRLREAVFGGTTREVLDTARLPVLFSA